MKKEVRYLTVGDVLTGSGVKVIKTPSAGIDTPSGKIDIVVEYPNGRQYVKTWNKYNIVNVKDANDPPLRRADNAPELPIAEEDQQPVEDITQIDLQFKKGEGFWNVSKYPYGGDFGRFDGTETGRIIPGTVKIGGQIRVKLSDGRTVIPDARAVANMDRDQVLDLARPITKIV